MDPPRSGGRDTRSRSRVVCATQTPAANGRHCRCRYGRALQRWTPRLCTRAQFTRCSKRYGQRRAPDQLRGVGLGSIALSSLLAEDAVPPAQAAADDLTSPFAAKKAHFDAKVKRVIYLFQSGGPSQLDLFDYKPLLNERNTEELPESVRKGQRLTGMTSGQASFPLAGSIFNFKQHGKSGAWISDLLPHTAGVADELCFIKSMFTEAINHDPAITFLQTGAQLSGRPAMGSWLDYGLGSDNQNLPSFVVLVTKDKRGQPLYARLWGNGFLPSEHQGVQFRSGKDPVLYLNNPPGIENDDRRRQLDHLKELQTLQYDAFGDPCCSLSKAKLLTCLLSLYIWSRRSTGVSSNHPAARCVSSAIRLWAFAATKLINSRLCFSERLARYHKVPAAISSDLFSSIGSTLSGVSSLVWRVLSGQ